MNPWIEHVRAYATKHKISYACAVSEASKTYTKKTNKKETPTPEPKKEEPKPKPKKPTNAFELFKNDRIVNTEPIKISTEKRTQAQIQESIKVNNKLAKQDSALKRRLVKKLYDGSMTKKEEKDIKLLDKEIQEDKAKYLASLTPEQRAIRDAPMSGFKKKKNPFLIL
jgi:cell fate regulator YaaT (PSP1 superfamily)